MEILEILNNFGKFTGFWSPGGGALSIRSFEHAGFWVMRVSIGFWKSICLQIAENLGRKPGAHDFGSFWPFLVIFDDFWEILEIFRKSWEKF
jgi:hypothetical protein